MKSQKFMTVLRTTFMLAAIAVMGVVFSACSDDDNPTATPNLVELASSEADFSILVAALSEFPDLLTTLSNESAEFTVFAPTNEAFEQLLEDLGAESLDDIPSETLRDVLEYHVLAGAAFAADLDATGYTTVNGADFYVSLNTAGVFINGVVEVIETDIEASNGVVHVVNRVIMPPSQTIAGIVIDYTESETPQFTQLLAALARTEGTEDDLLAAVLDAEQNLTVFAPTDAAFQDLLDALELESVDQIPLETLVLVLQHHVVAGRVFSTDLTSGQVPTLNTNATVNVTNLTLTGSSGGENVANLVPTSLNVHATNGVIHVIDRVLLPNNLPQ